ncbi:MAG TPA: hypothetical protein VIM61_08010 [Chthoniobacterales bacterium]
MTPEALLGAIIFGSIGMGAFVYGKRNGSWRPLVIGIALMVYPYFIAGTAMLYAIGAALTFALFLFRE